MVEMCNVNLSSTLIISDLHRQNFLGIQYLKSSFILLLYVIHMAVNFAAYFHAKT